MGLSRVKAVEKIHEIISKMSVALDYANVRASTLDISKVDLKKVPATIVRDGLTWIMGIYEGVYQEFHKIWIMQEAKNWHWYFMTGDFEDHLEMKLLRKALKSFKKVVTNRQKPDLFKKGKMREYAKKQNKESTGDAPSNS